MIYLKLSNVYNSIIIDVDCFVAYWQLAAFIKKTLNVMSVSINKN